MLATKDIIKAMGNFMDETTVNEMCWSFLELINESDRWKELNIKYADDNENGDTEIDKQNREFLNEEIKVEDEL